MGQRTPLYDLHVALGAKLVDFGGWNMPLHYGSQIEEHNVVRADAGMFDVSHLTIVDVAGADSAAWLRRLLANNIDRLQHRFNYSTAIIQNGNDGSTARYGTSHGTQ